MKKINKKIFLKNKQMNKITKKVLNRVLKILKYKHQKMTQNQIKSHKAKINIKKANKINQQIKKEYYLE